MANANHTLFSEAKLSVAELLDDARNYCEEREIPEEKHCDYIALYIWATKQDFSAGALQRALEDLRGEIKRIADTLEGKLAGD